MCKGFWVRVGATGMLCSGAIMASVCSAGAQILGSPSPSNGAKSSTDKVHKKRHNKQGQVNNKPATYGVSAVKAAPIPRCSKASAAALNATYNWKGWIISPPPFEDSLTQDNDCYRTNLAKAGFGLVVYDAGLLETNTLNHFVPASNLQRYVGQRTTAVENLLGYLTYDLSRYGIPNGQLQVAGVQVSGTWIGFEPNEFGLTQLAYYQTALNGKLEFNIGYIGTDKVFEGTQVGGNIANVLGPSTSIHALIGASYAAIPTPAAVVRWNLSDRVYDKFAVERSIASTVAGGSLNALQVEHYSDPTGFNFSDTPYVFGLRYPTERELYINEIGYKHIALPGDPYTWIRLDTYYNSTDYENLQDTTQQTKNYAAQLFADRQIWQSEPDDRSTAYKGLYIGGTAAYADPKADSISEDFQARIYTYGLLNRPNDQISLLYEHQTISRYIADPIDTSATCLTGITCVRHGINQYTFLYNASIIPGAHLQMGVSYADHPSPTYSPNASGFGSAAAPVLPQLNIQHSLTFLAAFFVNL